MSLTSYVDVFPVVPQALPKLFAYTIQAVGDDLAAIGGKLAYRLKAKFGGNWIWCGGQIVADKQVQDGTLKDFLKELWGKKEESLKDAQSIKANLSWESSAWEQGDFAARGLLANFQNEIRKILEPKRQDFGKIRIDRDYALRGWAVNDIPAVSISVSSNIAHTQTLNQYITGLANLQDLIGMMVVVTLKDFKGEIVEITGNLGDRRDWLLSRSTDETTRNLIQRAPDNELTVKIETRTSKYIYIASMLRPIVRMGDLNRFGVNPRQVSKSLRLDPAIRYNLVREIAAIGKKHDIISDSFDSNSFPQAFLSAKEIGFVPELRVGKEQIHHEGQRIYRSLEQHGLFSRSSAFPDKSHPIKVGVINASPQSSRESLVQFLRDLKAALEKLNFSIESVQINGQREQRIERLSRANLENAVNRLEAAKSDILLVLFPGDAGQEQLEDEEGDSMYHALKSLAIGRGIPSQVVYEDT